MPVLEKNYIASTVDEAIEQGLAELKLTEHQVKIEVIQPGKKGFFGIGKSDAEVKLIVIDPTLKKFETLEAIQNRTNEQPEVEEHIISSPVESVEVVETKHQQANETVLQSTEQYIIDIIQAMGLSVSATSTRKNSSEVMINLESNEAARIIGKRGQVLNSLQLLAQNYYNHNEKGYTTVTLDIENYREKRKETLQNLALNMSKKAIATNKPVKFEPMPNYERKIMHQILTNIKNIETYSEGREPHRYLVIKAR